MNRRVILIVVLVVGTILYFVANEAKDRREKNTSVTAFGKNPSGTSVWLSLLQDSDISVELGQKALFTAGQIADYDIITIFSPNGGISAREANILQNFVEQGGTLWVSAHNLRTANNLRALMNALSWNLDFAENPEFANEQVQTTSPTEHLTFFKGNETYAVYAPSLFQVEGCKKDEFDCFFQMKDFGKGLVIFSMGLPPVNNVMIGLNDNRNIAFRFLHKYRSFLIDEYHHFFSDRTFWDLLNTPAFALTLLGIAVSVFLFFFFGHTHFHETSLLPDPKHRAQSFHDLNEKLILSAIDDPRAYSQALEGHAKFILSLNARDRAALEEPLAKLLPDENEKIMPLESFQKRAKALVLFHHEWLRKKGRL